MWGLLAKKKRLTLYQSVSRGLWCPIRSSIVMMDGIGMRGHR